MGFLSRFRGGDEPEQQTCPKCRMPAPIEAETCPECGWDCARPTTRRLPRRQHDRPGQRGGRARRLRPAEALAEQVNASATITTGASEAITETTERSPSRVATV